MLSVGLMVGGFVFGSVSLKAISADELKLMYCWRRGRPVGQVRTVTTVSEIKSTGDDEYDFAAILDKLSDSERERYLLDYLLTQITENLEDKKEK